MASLLSGMALACSNINADNAIYPLDNRSAPEIIDTCPKADQEGVSPSAVVKILVNKPLDPATVTPDAVLVGSARAHIRGNVYYDDRLITYIPVKPLAPGTRYDVYITSLVRDEDNFALTQGFEVFSFTTGEGGGDTCR